MMQFNFFLKLLRESFRDLLPIILVILFFQLAIIQSVPEGWVGTAIGLGIVGVGLAIFLQGLEIGVFPVGEGLARDFAKSGWTLWILIFGFLIGFGTTIAEPALAVIADKAASISSGRIDSTILRFVVAGSVGLAIFLGVFRIIKGHPIHYYIIVGYLLVVSVTFFAPPEIIGLSYDLGGVTTSTVTVPLVAALGIGLATNIEGRDPLIDGFGLIAFASLFPMITVMLYGILIEKFEVKSNTQIEEEELLHDKLVDADNMDLATVNIDGSNVRHSLSLEFSAVVIIVPADKKLDAIQAAHRAGASGVTVLNADGIGLEEMANFYRTSFEANDVVLLFLLPKYLVNEVLKSVIHSLHITTTGKGVAFAFPLSHMKGISLTKEDIFKERAYQVNLNKNNPIECVGDEIEDDFENSSQSTTDTK